ncbi:uncharacterized protein LOC123502508 [Portunus trituberculatus]|uniref:uncharacterized protein LOC123502508 n=1 Tax=Portunus trituberculatus TaxID=210409 RepID=UPI001E1D2187|nr:uncharacterized protein LOC123502508 [Portunus trituberculatus]
MTHCPAPHAAREAGSAGRVLESIPGIPTASGIGIGDSQKSDSCPPLLTLVGVDENEARSVAQDGSESSSTSDTTPATSFSLHATTDPSSLRSPVAVCVLALGVTCSNGGNSNGKLDAQHSTAQHSGEIGGELTIQRPDSTAVMSLVYLALSSLTTPTTNPSASATVSRSGKDSALHRAL